jgi:hypothetical protein
VNVDGWVDTVRSLVFDRRAGGWVSFAALVIVVGFLAGTWAAWLWETLETRRERRGPRTRTRKAATADRATGLLAWTVAALLPRRRKPGRVLAGFAAGCWVAAYATLLIDFRVAYPAAGVGTVAAVVWLWRRYRWARLVEEREAAEAARQAEDDRRRREWEEEQARRVRQVSAEVRAAHRTVRSAVPSRQVPRRYPTPV